MYNLSLSQDQVISRNQLREQIKAQVQQAATDAQQAAREGAITIQTQPGTPGAPVDAIATEVERISEGQRFATKLLTEKKSEG